MHKITLICTAHEEHGLCNVEDLLKIFQTIKPEVIFQELRPSEFDFYYKLGKLEPRAVKKYREIKTFNEVLVDRYDRQEMENVVVGVRKAFVYVDQTSEECYQLREKIERNTFQLGFKYLNGIDHAIKKDRISEIEDKTIIATGNQDLIHWLKAWRSITQQRNIFMVRNIYEYCKNNAFDTGVFWIGADHKMGILKEIEKYATTEANLITWNFYG